MPLKPTKRLLGQILSEGGFISRKDLDYALAEQKRTGELLGEILVRMGAIKPEELDFILPIQRDLATLDGAIGLYNSGRIEIGKMLVDLGHISAEQFRIALKKQRKTKKDICKILVEEGLVDHKRLSFFESLHNKTMTALLTAIVSLASVTVNEMTKAQAADRDETSGAVAVTATVEGRATVKMISQTNELVITNTDAERGYVDVPLGSIIEIRSNSRYALVFEPLMGPFKAMEIGGLQRGGVEISEIGGWIVEPYPGKGFHTLELGYKFLLSENAEPGTYPWPVRLSVRPM